MGQEKEEEKSPLEKALDEVRKHPSDATVSYGQIVRILELLAAR